MGVSGASAAYGVQQAFSIAMMKTSNAMPAQIVGELMEGMTAAGDLALPVGTNDLLGSLVDEYV